MIELRGYIDESGNRPFANWLEELDASAAAKVTIALTRMEQGNFSKTKGVGAGVYEYKIDFGPEIGIKRSSAQITHYDRAELEDTLVVGVVNFPPRQIGPFFSEVLVLGALDDEYGVVLLRPDRDAAVGDRIG